MPREMSSVGPPRQRLRAEEMSRRSGRARPDNLSTIAAGAGATHPREDVAGARLVIQGPFHLEATVRILQRRPANRVDAWDRNRYQRVLTTADGPVLIEVHTKAIESGELTKAAIAGMSPGLALKHLVDLPGIGPWSAGVVLLRGFGRLDVFPPRDVGALRGLRALLHLLPGQSLDPVLKRFGAHRGHLYFCALGASLAPPASSFAARSALLRIRGDSV
jgi:hypothetical protein